MSREENHPLTEVQFNDLIHFIEINSKRITMIQTGVAGYQMDAVTRLCDQLRQKLKSTLVKPSPHCE